jgi:hypothetical protein
VRFMIIAKATKDSEAGLMPNAELLRDMGKFNQDLIDAGIFVAGDGLQASSKGVRVAFSGQDRTVTMGPFPDTKDLVAGYWIWNVKSIDEAIVGSSAARTRCRARLISKSAKSSRRKTSLWPK